LFIWRWGVLFISFPFLAFSLGCRADFGSQVHTEEFYEKGKKGSGIETGFSTMIWVDLMIINRLLQPMDGFMALFKYSLNFT